MSDLSNDTKKLTSKSRETIPLTSKITSEKLQLVMESLAQNISSTNLPDLIEIL
jgi:hypothetical protein